MKDVFIAGFIPNTFSDWPGKITSMVFLGGCNMRCYYCHNHRILCDTSNTIPYDGVLERIKEQIGFIDGVVISGGEPTLHPHLRKIINSIRELGLPVKIHTNGTNPKLIKELVNEGLLDFVAMDIKAPFEKYEKITCVHVNMDNIRGSIDFLKSQNKVGYLFRITPAPNLTEQDIEKVKEIAGEGNLKINNYNPQ